MTAPGLDALVLDLVASTGRTGVAYGLVRGRLAAAGHPHPQPDVSAALDRLLADGRLLWRHWPRPQLVAGPPPPPAPPAPPPWDQPPLDAP